MEYKKEIFRLINKNNSLIIEVFIAEEEKFLPFLGPFFSENELKENIFLIHEELQSILEKSKNIFKKETAQGLKDMDAKQIWDVLNKIEYEQEFIETFNSLDEEKRREMAKFIFAHCNIFSGNASIFSVRYNNESALLE